jgi:hypothetical protein
LTILVDDENDNNPKFRMPYFQRSITENSKIGVVIMHVTADDADKNRTVRYSLESPDNDLITLDPDTGEIHVGNKIDREQHSWINFTIRATDNGVPPRHSFAECYIQVKSACRFQRYATGSTPTSCKLHSTRLWTNAEIFYFDG